MNGAAAVPAPTEQPESADLAAWLAVAAGTLGAFMALLDISIVNAALPVIQGEIGATQSEGTWVSTSFLVAEIVVMPLTAWLERLFGLRRVLLVGAGVFTVFSVICGFATDLTTMILGRVGQGLAGGTMIPTGMTIMAKRLPPRQQSAGMALFAAAALLGPIVGPLAGGWITENYSWHYAFFINVPICAGLVLLILAGLPPEQGDKTQFANADWFGVFGMVVGLGAITVLLEEGHREQWFDSILIWQLAAAGITGFTLVAIGQMRSATPVLNLSLLRDRGLASVLLLTTVMGCAMFATLFIVPQFLAAIAGYNAFQAGQVLLLMGFASLIGSVLYPVIIARVDVRIVVGCSCFLIATASYLSSQVTAETTGDQFALSLFVLGLGIVFSAIPLQQAAISAVRVEDSGEVTSMFNIARNIGGAIGLAAIASFMDLRLEFHHWRLNESLGANDLAAHTHLGQMSVNPDGGVASLTNAYRLLDAQIMREAMVMSFGDIFLMLSIASLISAPLVLLMKPIDPERAKGMTH
ncbi:MAG: MDR family MFS transporter [Novosphingobium sp.]|nr:MDR family MFS transporter [Novosphingobium sp.]